MHYFDGQVVEQGINNPGYDATRAIQQQFEREKADRPGWLMHVVRYVPFLGQVVAVRLGTVDRLSD